MGIASFEEQLSTVVSWFHEWNDCDRVFFIFSIMKKLKRKQLKFLSFVIDDKLKVLTTDYDLLEEKQANDSNFLRNLLQKETKLDTLKQLLYHLPLLNPDNLPAKHEYLSPLFKLFNEVVCNIKNENRDEYFEVKSHIISYLLIHPAVHREEISDVAPLINGLRNNSKSESLFFNNNYHNSNEIFNEMPYLESDQLSHSYSKISKNIPLTSQLMNFDKSSSETLNMDLNKFMNQEIHHHCDPSYSDFLFKENVCIDHANNNQDIVSNSELLAGQSLNYSKVLRDSYVKQPLTSCSSLPLNMEEKKNSINKPYIVSAQPIHQKLSRTVSIMPTNNHWPLKLSTSFVHHKPISPQSSSASTDSNDSGQDKQINEESDQINVWLKSLRLHKYSNLFKRITIDELSSLTEDWLLKQGVTKGASNKILINIQKLKERFQIIFKIEKQLNDQYFKLDIILSELFLLIQTPIKVIANDNIFNNDNTDPDLTECFLRVFAKICTILLMEKYPDQLNLHTFIQILDHCKSHPAFSSEKKKKLIPWRHQINKIYQSIKHINISDKPKNVNLNGSLYINRLHRPLTMQRSSPSYALSNNRISNFPVSCSYKSQFVDETKKSTNLVNNKQQLIRTQSEPMKTSSLSIPKSEDQNFVDSDDHSLNLDPSMQKHALGDIFNDFLHI